MSTTDQAYFGAQLSEHFGDGTSFPQGTYQSGIVDSDGSLSSSSDENGGALDALGTPLNAAHDGGLVSAAVVPELDPVIGTQPPMRWPMSPVGEANSFYTLAPGVPQHPNDPQLNVGLSSSAAGLESDISSAIPDLTSDANWNPSGYGAWNGGSIYALPGSYQESAVPPPPRRLSRASNASVPPSLSMDSHSAFSPARGHRNIATDFAPEPHTPTFGPGTTVEGALASPSRPRPRHAPLPRPSKDAWTKEQEEFLVGSRRNKNKLSEIRAAMKTHYGVDRNTNVLSKKYQKLVEREAEDSLVQQALKNALPSMMQCLDDEMMKLDGMDEQVLREIREDLKEKLPKFVRKLAMDKPGH